MQLQKQFVSTLGQRERERKRSQVALAEDRGRSESSRESELQCWYKWRCSWWANRGVDAAVLLLRDTPPPWVHPTNQRLLLQQ